MTVKQLSVFIENKSGRLNEILDIIGQSEIRIIAATVADTSEYGILRLITNDNEKSYQLLKENRVSVNLSEVLVLSNNSAAGEFSRQLKCFANSGISIEYMYCFSVKSKAFMIIRASDKDGALQVIANCGLTAISELELREL